MPVYNEVGWIEPLVTRIARVAPMAELIIVNDGSTDGTGERLNRIEWPGVLVTRTHPMRRGKGAALRTGITAATRDIVIFQDADLEYDPSDYRLLVSPIVDGRADVVYGSRFTGSGPRRAMYFWHYCANRGITLCSNIATGLSLTDVETGYKAGSVPSLVEKRLGATPLRNES